MIEQKLRKMKSKLRTFKYVYSLWPNANIGIFKRCKEKDETKQKCCTILYKLLYFKAGQLLTILLFCNQLESNNYFFYILNWDMVNYMQFCSF